MLEFSLKTWNCFGLPQGIFAILRANGPPAAHRLLHQGLHSAIAEREIVCVQELWMSEAIRLFEGLPHPHKIRDHTGMSLFPPALVGAGLGIASRFPIASSRLVRFKRPFSGADRLARKGMLHARVVLRGSPRVELDLLTAHWQAERGRKSQVVRARQMHELADLVASVGSPERPFFLCGDFNINGLAERRGDEYDALVKLLDGFQDLGALGDKPTFHPLFNLLARRFFPHEPEQRLDYIFFRPAARGPRLAITSVDVSLDEPLAESAAGPSTFASDHYALRASFRLED